MGHRRIIELVIVGLWLTIATVLFIHYSRDKGAPPVPESLVPPVFHPEKGKKYEVRKLTVLRGDSFDLTIKDNDTRILAKLPVTATENAKSKVLDLLNHCTNPKVVLRDRQPDSHWTIDFYFTNTEGKEVNLVEWLSSNNLVYK